MAALAFGPGSAQMSLGPYCACNSCLVIFMSPRRIRLCGCAASVGCAAADPIGVGSFSSFRPQDEIEKERIFGGADLIAAEEARSREIGKCVQRSPRADTAGARPRPAQSGRCKQSMCSARVHQIPAALSIEHVHLFCTANLLRPASSL